MVKGFGSIHFSSSEITMLSLQPFDINFSCTVNHINFHNRLRQQADIDSEKLFGSFINFFQTGLHPFIVGGPY